MSGMIELLDWASDMLHRGVCPCYCENTGEVGHRTYCELDKWDKAYAAAKPREMVVQYVPVIDDDDSPDGWLWIAFVNDECHFQSSGSISPKAACELDARRVADSLGLTLKVEGEEDEA